MAEQPDHALTILENGTTQQCQAERFQQAMKNRLRAQPTQPATLDELQAQLDAFASTYNTRRHQGIAQRIPDAEHDTPPPVITNLGSRRILRKSVMGGLINKYTHAA